MKIRRDNGDPNPWEKTATAVCSHGGIDDDGNYYTVEAGVRYIVDGAVDETLFVYEEVD